MEEVLETGIENEGDTAVNYAGQGRKQEQEQGQGQGTSSSSAVLVVNTYVDAWQNEGRPSVSQTRKGSASAAAEGRALNGISQGN